MVVQRIPLIDRLQERGLIDRWGFTVFAAVGSLAILAAKTFSLPTPAVALGAIGLMLLYAVLVNMRGTGKLRSDQAGDNCYYLGLIFTLTSLSYAIFTFDPEKTATTIVQGFGIALATTIVGLVLRVFFSQSRVDLFEVEDTARLELAEAAGRLKTELSQIALEFTHFAVGLQQSVGEVRDEAAESVRQTTAESINAVKSVAAEAAESLAKHNDELSGYATELSKKTATVSRSIDRYTKTIDEISDGHKTLVADVKRAATLAKDMKDYSKQLVDDSQVVSALQNKSNEIFSGFDEMSARTMGSVHSSLQTIQKFEREFAARLRDLENGPKMVADKALHAIAAAAESVNLAMSQLTTAHEQNAQVSAETAKAAILTVSTAQEQAIASAAASANDALSQLSLAQEEAVRSVSSSTESVLEVVRGHNAELAQELSKARANALQIHQFAATVPQNVRPVA